MRAPVAAAAVLLAVGLSVPPAIAAGRSAELHELTRLLGFAETVQIMREEGLSYGAELRDSMVPDASPAVWEAAVARIYDTDKMLDVVTEEFDTALAGADLAPMLAYFRGDEGQEIVRMELAARRAFMAEGIEDGARAMVAELAEADAPLLGQVDTLIADSDMVEFNVMGQLNAQLNFYRGLVEGGAFEMTEEEMLSDVWAQEEAAREDSRDWLRAFMTMAYQPVDDPVLERYAEFYRTEPGQDLNRALFAGFDRMYDELSYLLGFAVAEQMRSQPL